MMTLQASVELVHPEIFSASSSDVQVIRERHSASKEAMQTKVRAAMGDPGKTGRAKTRSMMREMRYPTMSPGRGATLMPSNYGRSGTGRSPGGRTGSALY